ncbi:MAG: thermonuclease family protein [bacterium]|nr:thermonuclease family protein [bacterium]
MKKPAKIVIIIITVVLAIIFSLANWGVVNKRSNETISPSPAVEGVKEEVGPTESFPTPININITPAVESNKQEVKVTRVIDGDTIDVLINRKTERVRLIGINTPETVDPRKPVECFGKKAYQVANERLVGQTVWMEQDPSQTNRDRYHRLLRYIWTDGGTVDFGKKMIANGFAYEYTYNRSYKYQAIYKQAQKEAEEGKKGLWADNACPTPTENTNTGSGPVESGDSASYVCDCSKACTKIANCAEAQYQLNTCGCKQRDADQDGIACDGAPLKCQN